LAACIEEASSIKCQKDALEYLAKYLNITGYSKEVLYNKNQRINIVRNVLEREFLPHVGKDYNKKALYLGFMVNKLLKCFLRLKEFDDRDSYINKRVDTPGVLMANLFRQYYGKVVKDLKNLLQKEINNGGWKATNKFINVVNKVNVTKLFKSTVIDSGMRYALATGNWGIKNNKTKIGVAQVLNRMTYSSTLSHLRRINTPIEKSGKLIMPRKLHNTQWGVICPCETPEGSSVGLVKNMSLMASITISSNSINVKEIIVSLGTIEFVPCDLKKYAKMTKVIVNGAIFGFHETPNELYNELKAMKRRGYINVYTGIVWNIYDNEISVCTEGGRCIRPLFIVDKGKLPLESADTSKLIWNQLIRGNDNGEHSSVIEFLDVEEVNVSMIAMKYDDVRRGEKGGLLPINYTHLEIHPISILGVAAANIPFSDHNQAPRNCYQCLWEEELVLMADGSKKPIKDVKVGDRVVTFDNITMEVSTTRVIDQFVKETDKRVYRVKTSSGRSIIATYDHLFMTENGWTEVQYLQKDTCVAIFDTTIDNEYLKHLQSEKAHSHIPFHLWKKQVSRIYTTVFVPVDSITEVPNCMIADITVESDNHSFIAGDSFQVHNSSMSKQAIGIYASNYRHRFDTLAHVLNYGQKPLVRTKMAKILNSDTLPNGINAIVAIMTYTGYNQEDSVILNQSAIDRGLFTSTYYRTYKEQNNKNHSNGEEEFFTKPETTNVKGAKPFNYEKIEKDGFVMENTFVKSGDIIIGKCMPNKIGSVMSYKDNSISMKNNEKGFVDKNCYNDNYFKTVNGDGYSFCKVRIRSERVPVIGDKLASRAAQKGTIGMTYRQEDMPFSGNGIVPDIIMNPNAIPSRMTIGQLMETLLGKACAAIGNCGDSTPFTDLNVETIAQILENEGIEKYGNEVMYDPRTGQQMQCDIFIGPTFYQRLKHMTTDKIHSRGSSGPIILLTRQPAEGRARDGGLRMGEMEIECNWAHGVNMFLKERIMECSDNYRMHVCKQCGFMAIANPEKNLWLCRNCKNTTNFAEIRVPYAFKLLLQEIQSMSLGTKFIT
jgi:DNA-directed RNA polymerase II subunit RPB2